MTKYNKFYLISLICCLVVLIASAILQLVSQNSAVLETARYLYALEGGYFISLILSKAFKEQEHDDTNM